MNKPGVLGRPSTVSVSFKRETSGIIETFPDVTQGKTFPSLLLFMEAIYSFAVSSMAVYSMYGFGEFIIKYSDQEVLSMTTEPKFYGCCFVLILGILCDSYIGHYYSILTLLFITIVMPILHFTIAVYPFLYQSGAKLVLAEAANLFWGIMLCSEPLRVSVMASAVMGQSYFRKPRTFFGMLVYVWYFGAALGGLTVWLCNYSRVGYAIILGVDVIFMSVHAGFWLFSRNTLLYSRGPWAVVERSLAYVFCLICRKLDNYLLRSFFFKKKHDQKDFRCVTFSNRSVANARSVLGILLVTLPLTAYFCVVVILETLYNVQIGMLYYNDEPFPMVTVKAALYLILYPLLEFISSKFIDKWFRNSVTKQLCLTGIGAFIVGFALMWTSVVQHEIVKDLDFWRHLSSSLAYVSITNCLGFPVNIRGKYYNKLVSRKLDEWVTLEPMKPLFVLKIPATHLPFHLEFENSNVSLYDEYTLPLVPGSNRWYVLFPEGLRQVHTSCYTSSSHVSMNPKMFDPATVCVMCALAVCNGHLVFQGDDIAERFDVSLRENMEESKIHLSGKFLVSVRFGELAVSGAAIEVTFEKLGSYLMVVYETIHKTSTTKIKPEEIAAVHVLETLPPRRKSVWWIYPTVVLHAIGQVFAEVSLLTYLYLVSPIDVRTTVFCYTSFLCIPAYFYLFERSCVVLQDWMPIYFFSLGCANCFFMIIYFFCTVYYIHLFLFKRPPSRPRRSLVTSSDTNLRSPEDETVPDMNETSKER